MRKLVIMAASSTRHRLVLMHDDDSDGTGELYELAVTDQLRRIIAPTPPATTATVNTPGGNTSATESSSSSPVEPSPTSTSDGHDQPASHAPGTPHDKAVLSLPSTRKNAASTPVPTHPDLTPSTPVLPMRPRDIQNKIRHGASVEDIAKECNVPEKDIIPWAHPILQERQRMASLARTTHPSFGDESSTLTLSELVATELATRGIDPETATWDAYKNPANRWVVAITWPGLTGQTPEWELCQPGRTTATTLPLTPPAHAITGLPKRPAPREDEPVVHGQDALIPPPPGAEDVKPPSQGTGDGAAKKRKRSAETPHWEDILLGVRASTKRPRK